MTPFKMPLAWAAGALVLLPAAWAGPVNPDISVIGDTRVTWSESADKVDIGLHEVEFAFVGPVNPYASAEVYVAAHGGELFEIEEAKLILDRYLPWGLGLTAGRMLLDFGQLNTVHPHAYPFVERPLMHSVLFGDDGVLDNSLRLDWLAPVDAFTLRATAGLAQGDIMAGGHDHAEEEHAHEDEEEGAEVAPALAVTGRVEAFFEPGRDAALSVGASVLHGEHDPAEGAGGTFLDADAKLRLDLAPYRTLVFNAEAVLGSLDASEEAPASDPSGWFLSADLRADQRWNVGAFAESTSERMHDQATTGRYGAFLGLALLEESTLFRLVGSVTDPDAGESDTSVQLQIIFGLGPHRPHRY